MEEKIRLAVFGQKRLSREGGIEIVVKELCTRMAQNGCDVTCYNRAGHHVSGAEYDKTIEYDGIRQKVVPTIEKKGLAAVSSSFFAALCSAFGRYDVVHIHAEGPAFFCWIPKLFGKRVISTIHGLDWAREKWKFGVGSKFIRQGEKNAVKYADEIIVLSKGVQKYFMETYGRETHFIPNGVNRPEVREAKLITDHFGLEKDSYILFLGRLVPEKGIRYLVESDRTMITWLADASQTGIYSLIYNFSMIATVITTSLDGVWVPWFTKQMSNKGYKEINKVAVAISELIENESAYGETFHITTTESLSWEDVFKKYTSILSETTGKQFHIRYVDDIEMFYNIWNPYQIKYDCNIDRRFDNSKINRATNNKLQYTVFAEGINKCLKKFIESPEWRNINWKLNFWMDNITGEKTKIWDADGLKEKARYVKYCIKK